MKLYAPEYYRNFECIEDRCNHSCCIGWEIDVDEESAKKYSSLSGGYGENVKSSIERDGVPHFRLCEGDRCPHLNERGLCRIILELGEGYLCDICREHPRFYNDTSRGREVGVGIACEEAARLVLSSDLYSSFVEMNDDGEDEEIFDGDFDAIVERERIFAILSDRSYPYYDRLQRIYSDFDVSPDIMSDDAWRELFSSLEYLDESHRELFVAYSSTLDGESCPCELLERALAYFVFRHCSEAYDMAELRASLGFCLVLERMLSSLAKRREARTVAELIPLAQIISEELEYSEENTDLIKFEFEII